jgi:hypothetical protein
MAMQGNAISKILALVLGLLLAACADSGEGGVEAVQLAPADEAKAAAMLADYESARSAGNPEAAEAAADRLRERYPDSEPAQRLEATLAQVRSDAEAMRETRRLQGLWDYQANAVAGGTQRSASIFSRTVDLGEDAPAAMPDAQLVLRDHPDWGKSAYLLLAQKKFDCGKPCRVRIAFDAEPAEQWQGKQADSGKGPALFIEDEPKFLQRLQAAKQVRIELPQGSGHLSALVFEVAGFAPTRYASP